MSSSHVHTKAASLGDELAFPCLPPLDPNSGGSASGYPYPEMGLRKRELFAAFIMQGLVQDPNMTTMKRAAEGAVEGADALLDALSDDLRLASEDAP